MIGLVCGDTTVRPGVRTHDMASVQTHDSQALCEATVRPSVRTHDNQAQCGDT